MARQRMPDLQRGNALLGHETIDLKNCEPMAPHLCSQGLQYLLCLRVLDLGDRMHLG